MDINYEYYKIFYNVAKYGGFTVAAEKSWNRNWAWRCFTRRAETYA